MVCVVHMNVSPHTVRIEKNPSATADTRNAIGATRHRHHHSAVSKVAASLPTRAARSGFRNRFSDEL
jgi:hypothetical protein|tara:strand:+ start:2303 stop:2503 length:201 start_codon:yes stop_codon:yes gene_type:complete